MSHVLIVDDDRALARSLEIHLTELGHKVRTAHTLADAREKTASKPDEVVFLDLKLPDGDSRELLTEFRHKHPEIAVIMISGHQDMQATIEAIRMGAIDYIRKPLDLDQILGALSKAKGETRIETPEKAETALPPDMTMRPREIVGRSAAILDILKQIAVLSESRVTVLIQGETGTGKELVARALHEASSPGKPFVAVNCGGIVPTLLESELFGHEKGSFTGAVARKIGKLELAGEGTIFFDEVGDLPPDLQAKLLRALQEAEFERVGGTNCIPLKARVMAATNRDLARDVERGEFRQDLFFRLAVSHIEVPPLRERPEDIPLLAEYLIKRIGEELKRGPVRLSREAVEKLKAHPWPGNVRELENALTRAAAQLRDDVVHADQIHLRDLEPPQRDEVRFPPKVVPLREMERLYISHALARLGWNIKQASEALRISPTTLRKKIADYGLRGHRGSHPPESDDQTRN